jgi:hypothetical protein
MKDGCTLARERDHSNHLRMTAKKEEHRALGPDAPPFLDRRPLVVDAGERRGIGEKQQVASRRRETAFEGSGARAYFPLEREGGAFDRSPPGYRDAPEAGGTRRYDRRERRERKPAGPGA